MARVKQVQVHTARKIRSVHAWSYVGRRFAESCWAQGWQFDRGRWWVVDVVWRSLGQTARVRRMGNCPEVNG